jgi:hypothetical protein
MRVKIEIVEGPLEGRVWEGELEEVPAGYLVPSELGLPPSSHTAEEVARTREAIERTLLEHGEIRLSTARWTSTWPIVTEAP